MTDTPRADPWTEVRDLDALVALLGEPGERAATKSRPALLDVDREWLAASRELDRRRAHRAPAGPGNQQATPSRSAPWAL